MKQRTSYLLKESRNTVLRWVADCINKLMAKKIGSETQVDQDDFKAVMKQFAGRIKAVEEEITN